MSLPLRISLAVETETPARRATSEIVGTLTNSTSSSKGTKLQLRAVTYCPAAWGFSRVSVPLTERVKGPSLLGFVGLQMKLEDIAGRKVDLVTKLNRHLIPFVDKDLILLYGKK